jgi:hypothetical protein
VPVTELPPLTRFSQAEFKFNVRGVGDVELLPPPPQADNRAIVIREKPILSLALFSVCAVVLLDIIFY